MFKWFYWRGPTSPAKWTQKEDDDYDSWLDNLVAQAGNKPENFHPAVNELKDLIEKSTRLTQLVEGMYDEVSRRPVSHDRVPYITGVHDHKRMLRTLNCLLTVPILWDSYRYLIGWTSCPILSLFWRPLHTICGFAFFQDPEVNTVIKKVLDTWGQYLKSPESAWCLDTGPQCWFGPEAMTHLVSEANTTDDHPILAFEDIYICDPTKPRYGFISWDDFFTRRFHDHIRPVSHPTDTNVIVHACESTPRYVRHNVSHHDRFWTKGAPYSLHDMLGPANAHLTTHFVGGTVYQAYLSALSYHRWHAPVSGRVVHTCLIPGFYFTEPPYPAFDPGHAVAEPALRWNNAYQTAMSTRAVLFIDADSPDIGLMAALFVGLTEVSTCEISVHEGQRVEKGQEIGSFHCGGSTHCLIFRPAVDFVDLPDPDLVTANLPVRGYLARVKAGNPSLT